MKIVVLAGGLSPERNVSLSSGSMVCQALRDRGHQVALVDLFFGLEDHKGEPEELFNAPIPDSFKKVSRQAPDLEQVRASRKWKDTSAIGPGVLDLCKKADVVYLGLHGACGEDGRIQAALDLLGVPYTGSGYLSSAIAMDKDLTKRLVADKVVTPQWMRVDLTEEQLDGLVEEVSLPAVIKPVDSGSSIGVFIANDKVELRHALEESVKLGGRVVIEQYIKGREIQVAVLNGKPLPSIEITPKEGFYDYENKYQAGKTTEICPAPLTNAETAALEEATRKGFGVLRLRGYARFDFILDQSGTPWCLEANTLPGMTPTSLLPQAAAAVGIGYDELCERMVMMAVQKKK